MTQFQGLCIALQLLSLFFNISFFGAIIYWRLASIEAELKLHNAREMARWMKEIK